MKRITYIRLITLVILIICSCSALEAQGYRAPGNGDQLGSSSSSSRGGKGRGQSTREQLGGSRQRADDKRPKAKITKESYKDNYGQKQEKATKKASPKGSPSSNKSKPDSILVETDKNDKPVYYANIVRRNGWFVGIGKPLTENQIRHLDTYYKLSRKNIAGNWTFVETFDSRNNPTSPDFNFCYLANLNSTDDSNINSDWLEPLQSVNKWAFVSDASGRAVIQELAMDADSSTVYIFTPTKIGEREYLGYYTDQWGFPICLVQNEYGSNENCASRVHITRDRRGYDVLIKYIDDKGASQKNGDGAYMSQIEYDSDGNETLNAQLDILGKWMNDDWGNCGWKHTYRNGLLIESQCFDKDGNPLRMPKLKESVDNVYGYRYEYDNYGRQTAIIYIDNLGKPDVDSNGVHKVRFAYNDYGDITHLAFYDLENNLCAKSDGEYAQLFENYDKDGNMILQEFKDKDNNYIAGNSKDYCRIEFNYKDGINVHEISYVPDYSNPKKCIKSAEFIRDDKGNETTTWFHYGYQKIDSVDSQHRPILTAWYDLEHNPYDLEEGYHKHITSYYDKQGTVIEQWIDASGLPFYEEPERDYSTSVQVKDSDNHTITEIKLRGDTIISALQKEIDPKSGIAINWNDLTSNGEMARVGWLNSLYYKTISEVGINGNQKIVYSQNEFGEPSYTRTLEKDEQVFYIKDETHERFYDENCEEISSYGMEYFIQQLPRAYCIEITDTTAAAYHLGLRNGDIIVSYGDWTASNDLNSDMNDFYLETILKARSPKKVTLLRHHPSEKNSEIVTAFLPAGKTSDLGFYPHKIYYTHKEKERMIQTCSDNGISLCSPVVDGDASLLLAVQKKGSFNGTSLYYEPTDPNRDAGILLYVKSDEDIWSIGKDARKEARKEASMNATATNESAVNDVVIEAAAAAVEEAVVVDSVAAPYDPDNYYYYSSPENSIPLSSYYYTERQLFLTHDLNDLCQFKVKYYDNSGIDIIPVKVSRSYLERVRDFYAIHSQSNEIPSDYDIDDYRVLQDPTITAKNMTGTWHIKTSISEILSADITMQLDKNNKASFSMLLSWHETSELDEGNILELEISCHATPKWSLNGVCLELDFSDTNAKAKVTKIESTYLNDEGMLSFKEYGENLRNTIESFYSFGLIFDWDYMVIKEVSKKQFKAINGEKELIFTKVK